LKEPFEYVHVVCNGITVPCLQGQTVEEARKSLRSVGVEFVRLPLKVVREEKRDDVAPGRVVSQRPG
jgi:beta-lactam-binding protein with PASTA domain